MNICGGVTAATLSHIESRFISMINEYTDNAATSGRHPLMIYNNDANTASGGGDEAASTYFDRFFAKWMSRNSLSSTEGNKSGNKLIVYRFCNHTILASDVLTLLQSIVHQLCYILDVHESLAFEVCFSINIFDYLPDMLR